MKSNFALSLSFDGLRLMHRVEGGWHLVGQVALDDPDLSGSLSRLRAAAAELESGPMATKLLIPNDQIRYLALDTTRAEEHDVVAALDGATPYPVADLVYDYAKGGGRTYVAAVARETLDEAYSFADEHGFSPVSFAAVPEPFTYVGEVFFGPVAGRDAERDTDAVIVIGEAAVTIAAPDPVPEVSDTPSHPEQTPPEAPVEAADDAPEPEAAKADTTPLPSDDAPAESGQQDFDEAGSEDASPEQSQTDATETLPEETQDLFAVADLTPEPSQPTEPDGTGDSEFSPLEIPPSVDVDPVPQEDLAPQESGEETVTDNAEETPSIIDETPAAPAPIEDEPTPEANELPLPDATGGPDGNEPSDDPAEAAPVFASLRADRNEGRPTPVDEPTADTEVREEPTFSRRTPPALAVPTGSGTDPMPPVVAPSRDDIDVPAPTAPTPVSADLPEPIDAPAITGEAPSTLSPDAALSAASLSAEPDTEAPDETPEPSEKSATAVAMGAASAVTGAVGGMFASRRMARAEAKIAAAEKKTETAVDEKSRFTVFGARKKPKPKPVVGGKPKFLGLILTAVLLLFLLAIAAFAALSDDTIARWFGFDRGEDTQVAEAETAPDAAIPEVSPVEPTTLATAPDALAAPTAPTGGQILTPEEAQRIYAATGVWQRAPRIPQTPRTTSLDDLQLAAAVAPVIRVPASPLADASSVAGDAVIATPVDPPPPSATFNFGTDGLVVATPEGTPTPDGVLIIAGSPSLNPPTRPGTIAPEITPQDQLAAVIPEQATPVPDAPAGVIVISGSPSIRPPVRTGTVAPVAPSQVLAATTGDAPLQATNDLLVLAGTPPVLPPARPGTTAPDVSTEAGTGTDIATPTLDQGGLDALSADIASALGATTAQAPTANTARPLVRPETVTFAAAARANTPVLGALTNDQAAAFRPLLRPVGLAPVAPTAPIEDVAIPVAAEPTPPQGLQINSEIAAAVEAAANRPNPILNPTAQAVAQSERPDTRPRNMARIVARAEAAQERAATQVAAAVPNAIAPSGPTAGAVAQNATLENAINLRDVNLIGIYGGSNDRRALVRLGNGRFLRLTAGDRLDGGRVTAIGANALSYTKNGRAITLEVPG